MDFNINICMKKVLKNRRKNSHFFYIFGLSTNGFGNLNVYGSLYLDYGMYILLGFFRRDIKSITDIFVCNL